MCEEFPLTEPPAQRLLKGLMAETTDGPSAAYVYGLESHGVLPCEEDLDDHLFAY